jgi:hypothetical protein
MNPKTQNPSESSVRQKAKRRLWSLVKTNRNSQGFHERSRFALADGRNVIRYSDLSLQKASDILTSIPVARRGVDFH